MVGYVTETVDLCINCENGCRGQSCPYFPYKVTTKKLYCDDCKKEAPQVYLAPYQTEEAYICENCLNERLEENTFTVEDF